MEETFDTFELLLLDIKKEIFYMSNVYSITKEYYETI